MWDLGSQVTDKQIHWDVDLYFKPGGGGPDENIVYVVICIPFNNTLYQQLYL